MSSGRCRDGLESVHGIKGRLSIIFRAIKDKPTLPIEEAVAPVEDEQILVDAKNAAAHLVKIALKDMHGKKLGANLVSYI